jgi:hypothetical protein
VRVKRQKGYFMSEVRSSYLKSYSAFSPSAAALARAARAAYKRLNSRMAKNHNLAFACEFGKTQRRTFAHNK